MNKKISVGLAITIAIIAMTVTFSVTMILSRQLYDKTVTAVQEKASMYDKLAELDKYVRGNLYFDINQDTLLDTIASGYMLGTGDKNATYYTAKAYKELQDIQNGVLVGIGVDLVKDTSGYAKIIKVYPGSPAAELGMERGGYITSVDGVEVKSILTRDAVLGKLRGEPGTSCAVGYLTPASDPKEFTVQRTSYPMPTVDYQLIQENVGYIRIYSFGTSTPSELEYAAGQMKSVGATSLLIDLRDNAGGLLSSAVSSVDLLAPEGAIAYAEYKDGTQKTIGTSDERRVDLPIVCLVNGTTASSAELFAASLREFGVARLVGTNTYGKGTIQASPQKLSDGSAVVVTVAKLLTGEKQSFDGTGLTVDVEVTLTPDEIQAYFDMTVDNDPQIKRAVEVAKNLVVASQPSAEEQAASSQPASSEPEESSSVPEDASSEPESVPEEAESSSEEASTEDESASEEAESSSAAESSSDSASN